MAKSFKNLRDKMSPRAKEVSKQIAQGLEREIMLTELRNVLGVNQEELAQLLNKKQAAISRLETAFRYAYFHAQSVYQSTRRQIGNYRQFSRCRLSY